MRVSDQISDLDSQVPIRMSNIETQRSWNQCHPTILRGRQR